MGRVKTLERRGKGWLMNVLGRFLRARAMTPETFREQRFSSIVVVRQHNQMGDMMLAIPALRALKETYPDARLGVVTSTLNRGVLENHPYVDRVFTYDKRGPFGHVRLIADLRRARYDLAIVLHTVSFSFTSLMLAVLSGARVRIGSTAAHIGDSLTGSYLNLTLPLPSAAELAGMNEAEHNLYPLRAVGITTDDIAPLIVPRLASREWARSVAGQAWRDGTVRLAVHPGAGKTENIWPAERFADVVNRIARHTPVSLAIIEGPRDQGPVAAFGAACEVRGTVVSGRPIVDVAALLQLADLVICNDTGVMHVSAAAGARTLALFGPTDPGRWAPRSKDLAIARADDGILMSLSAEVVAAQALELIALAKRDL